MAVGIVPMHSIRCGFVGKRLNVIAEMSMMSIMTQISDPLPSIDFTMEVDSENGIRVLILDPTSSAWKAWETQLDSRGLRLNVVSGAAMLDEGAIAQADILVISVEFEADGGFVCCERIREGKENPEIPIIMMSSSRSLEERSRAFKVGANDFMQKPFPLEEFLARVHSHVNTAKLREALRKSNNRLETKVKERTQELERANDALNVANERLSSIGRLKSRFLDIISHELRTPLNGILGAMDLIKSEWVEEPDEELEEIYETSKSRLLSLIQDSMLLGQMESMVDTVEAHWIDLDAIVNPVMAAIPHSRKSDESQRLGTLQSLVPPELFALAIEKLGEMVTRFAAAGEVIWHCAEREHEMEIHIFLKDVSVPESLLDHFFEPFEVSEHETIAGDLGLRPALVGEMLKLAQGTIRLCNEGSSGLKFEVCLPKSPER